MGIIYDWLDTKYRNVPSQHTAASKVNKLKPEEHSIPEAAAVDEQARIPLACIALLALVHPLMTAPYLSPSAAYTLLLARASFWSWDDPLAPQMKWLRESLYQTCLRVKFLPPLEMDDQITVGRQNLQQQLVPYTPAGPATPSLT